MSDYPLVLKFPQVQKIEAAKTADKKTRKEGPASPSVPTEKVETPKVEGVVGLAGISPSAEGSGPKTFVWRVEDGSGVNFKGLGEALAASNQNLYRNGRSGNGLLVVGRDNKTRTVTKGAELLPIIADCLPMVVMKEGKILCELPAVGKLQAALASEKFLNSFRAADEVSELPIYLEGFRLAKPGLNQSNGEAVLYLGAAPTSAATVKTITDFLDVMEWETNADRTNAVGAALTLRLRRFWPGGKPLVLVTATKSHSGKGTVVDFVQGPTPAANILYEKTDWPTERRFHEKLQAEPSVGLIKFDNVRLDSSGGGAFIRGGFVEGFITDAKIDLVSPGMGGNFVAPNRYVVCINTNEGTLSADLLNRSLPIHLAPKGNITDRRSPIGNPKMDYLPRHQATIEAELHGMIARWTAAGQPTDDDVKHPMSPWARVVGGILKVNGFTDFLANYGAARIAQDPIREALGILAAAHPGETDAEKDWKKGQEWGEDAHKEGLDHILFRTGERTPMGRARRIGDLLTKRFLGETLVGAKDGVRYKFVVEKLVKRWDTVDEEGKPTKTTPEVRYRFRVEDSQPIEEMTEKA